MQESPPEYKRQSGETEAQMAARVARLETARIKKQQEPKQEVDKLEMHLRPKGPQRSF